MERARATVVAIKSSGETVMAIVAAGTRTPPTPKPQIVPRATASFGVSGVRAARAPPNEAVGCQWLDGDWECEEERTHEDASAEKKCLIMAFPYGEKSIADRCAHSNAHTVSEALEPNLDGVRIVKGRESEGEKIE